MGPFTLSHEPTMPRRDMAISFPHRRKPEVCGYMPHWPAALKPFFYRPTSASLFSDNLNSWWLNLNGNIIFRRQINLDIRVIIHGKCR